MNRKPIMIVLTILILMFSGCLREEPAIRIGTNAWPPCEVWTIAESRGFFGDVPVEIIRFTNWSDNMSALYKDNIDITHSTYFNTVYYHDKGVPGKIILSSDSILGGDGLVVSSDIMAPGDLKGKRIAVEINTDEHFLLYKALKSFNISEDEVTIVSTTSSKAAEMFIEGEVDACFTYSPFMEAAAEGGGRIMWTTEELPGYMIDVLAAKTDTIEKRSEDLTTVIEAWYKALDYIEKNRMESFRQMSQDQGFTVEEYSVFFDGFKFYTAGENREIFRSPSFVERLEEMNTFLYEHGAISKMAEVGWLYDSWIIENMEP